MNLVKTYSKYNIPILSPFQVANMWIKHQESLLFVVSGIYVILVERSLGHAEMNNVSRGRG